ncbi:S1-like domain-containing RNA-binding protein [Enterovibrio sp. ZSDZ35]|uniref:S1-like domain-containing RNA-binding protein n=1 Tax=Enterovibrio qingdaonensis TaxID=2899818 RepID=A0ABT5QIG9_9GAMM|nr:S1-like domain-containing RNA-binding protein [Enterovibrio sp. ZSDZ35]MDD1780649.1 S1-like domain-containing RNA-binding protein [Enterovibrio sp. ZSDZ35]
MIKIGQVNTLTVVKEVEFGVFVDGGREYGNILLPKRYVPKGTLLGDEISVFIYFDSEDNIIATTEKPLAEVGQFAKLNCVSASRIGAFLNWGLPKDLLVPFSEQRMRMQEGNSYLVYLYLDNASGRIVGSTKFNKFLDKTPARYQKGEQVNITVVEETELGYKCAVNDMHWGLLFKTEAFGKLFVGKNLKAYIKQMREDGKIDLALQKLGKGKVDDLADKVIHTLELKGGFLPVNDKSSPAQIFDLFRTSKATFKKTIGGLYKERRIRIERDGIYLIK